MNHNLEVGIESSSTADSSDCKTRSRGKREIERWETRRVGDGKGDADFDEDLVFYEGDFMLDQSLCLMTITNVS